MGIDESYVFSLSSSDGDSKPEDCALMIWNSATLTVPENNKTIKKNHNGQLRNCVFPAINYNSQNDQLIVNVIAEYMPVFQDTRTGFLQYYIYSDYSQFAKIDNSKKYELKYINN